MPSLRSVGYTLYVLIKFFVYHFPKNFISGWLWPSQSPYLKGNFGPVQDEIDADNLEIVGTIPPEIDGVFVRNGPNPHFQPKGDYHWFDGDGMLHAITIANGKASYKNRYVQTMRWKHEQQKKGEVYPKIVNIQNPAFFFILLVKSVFAAALGGVLGRSSNPKHGVANTSVEFHDGRLLALAEPDLPYHVRLPSLETLGQHNYDGKLDHPFTAHPKIDPVTGEMIFFGYRLAPPVYLNYSVVSNEGQLVRDFPVDLEVPVMMHDFAITEHYSVFLDLPITFRVSRMFHGKPPLAFEKDRRGRIGVIPRHATSGKEMRWFEIATCWVYHTANAWEVSEDKIVLVACRSNVTHSLNADVLSGKVRLSPQEVLEGNPHLYRWEINLKAGTVAGKQLDDGATEFPAINLNLMGRQSRYVYCGMLVSPSSFPGVVKVDLQTGEKQHITYGPRRAGAEAIFIPRDPHAKATPKNEDDGFLITYIYDEQTDNSECWIMDARTMSPDPLARIKLPRRVPYGFHGKWITAEQLKSQRS